MKDALVKNTADEEQVKTAKVKELSQAEKKKEDLKEILQNKKVRSYLWDVLGECGLFRTSFTGNSTTFFNEGARNIGLKIFSEIQEASPEAFLIMTKEAKEKTNVRG